MLKFFSSMQAGLVIMGLIIIASIVGTLQPQSSIYQAFWFNGLLLLLTINLTVCTSRRLPGLLEKFKGFSPEDKEKFPVEQGIQVDNSRNSEAKILEALKNKGYKIDLFAESDYSRIAARKGMLYLVAPHLIHISLIVIFVGALIGSTGETANVGGYVGDVTDIPEKVAKSHLHLEIKDFKTIYDKDKAVDNWESSIAVLAGDRVVAEGTTKVNHPFKYKGMTFYQSGYGYNHMIEVKGEAEGKHLIPLNKVLSLAGRMFKIEKAPGTGYVLKVYESHTKFDTYELKEGTVVNFPNATTMKYLGEKPYTVLKVKTDPGTPVVMGGFFLMTLASFLFWTGSYREIKIGFNHTKQLARFQVICRNKSVQEELHKELTALL
ncbi:MAG: ResB protein required for cytochrome c biosynthesis-like protein [Peptococcaceae bacterium]|jgi:cytochrome c biogenesis protein|nr:ResB protein required for cytochrome c biosynthesis-like protein [Peptococcaceae bacterium]